MREFSIIYKLLNILRTSMDYEDFDAELISSNALGISEAKRAYIIEMLVNDGYITGVTVQHMMGNVANVKLHRPRITLKGLEYLEENSLMKKAARIAKGIKDIVS